MRTKQNGARFFWSKWGQAALCALAVTLIIWNASHVTASGNDSARIAQNSAAGAAVVPTPTPTPTATPIQEINGIGTIAGPNGGPAQFSIIDVEPEQITQNFLEGAFAYRDTGSHIKFSTGKITTVTINGNQAAFSGTAKIGKQKQVVNFTVSVTGNQSSPNADTFTISLSNGYSAGGTLTKGSITIDQEDD